MHAAPEPLFQEPRREGVQAPRAIPLYGTRELGRRLLLQTTLAARRLVSKSVYRLHGVTDQNDGSARLEEEALLLRRKEVLRFVHQHDVVGVELGAERTPLVADVSTHAAWVSRSWASFAIGYDANSAFQSQPFVANRR